MFTKSLVVLFAWAFVLEILVLVYYLIRGMRPVEFYMDIGLLVLTIVFLIFLVLKEKKRRTRE
ncbi:MAG: hypothetical protein PWP37_362 [Thermotogota bacterium]|nr:hypothetical protein [Thermotogota bacterium]MDK2864170.1 hypothetical protein [Thermotogota bacterium]HCZ06160.1 hypothetical protein [Thermotogota bacterium]